MDCTMHPLNCWGLAKIVVKAYVSTYTAAGPGVVSVTFQIKGKSESLV